MWHDDRTLELFPEFEGPEIFTQPERAKGEREREGERGGKGRGDRERVWRGEGEMEREDRGREGKDEGRGG